MTYIFANLHWFVLLIGALVFFHELGHFLVAKACGVKVLRFSLGFGPRLFSWKHGDTEYQLSALPLGGYVKMLGEVPGSDVPLEERQRAFSHKSVWQRAAIVSAGPVFNFALACIVYFCMFLGVHKVGDTKLGIVTQDEPAWQAGMRPGDRVVVVDGETVSRWDELREQIARRPGTPLHITYERQGERHDVTVTTTSRNEENVFQEVEVRGKIGVSLQYLRPVLAVVDDQSPAAQAGLKTGDTVVQVDDTAVHAWHEVRDAVAKQVPGSPLILSVQRAGEAAATPRRVTLMPAAPRPELGSALFSAADTAEGYTGLVNKDSVVASVEPNTPAAAEGLQVGDRLLELTIVAPGGRMTRRPIGVWGVDLASIGIDPHSELTLRFQRGNAVMARTMHFQARRETDELKNVRTEYGLGVNNDSEVLDTYLSEQNVGVLQAALEAGRKVGEDMTTIVRGISKMARGSISFNNMGGPIMLFVIAEKSAKRGAMYYFGTMAMISVNLGIINILPIPALDGGHLLFCLIEVVSRRPPSVRVREVANIAGVALLLVLMVFVFRNDFFRFVLGGA